MPRRFQMLVVASLVATVFNVHSHRAWSGEKHRRTICCQPIATCQPMACQTAGPVPTCCQPVAATISSSSSPIEFCAHAQPAPRRLTPQPDSLEINPTSVQTFCAVFMYADWGTYQSYYAYNCTTQSPANLNGNNVGPLPGNCSDPGSGACVTVGSSVVPTASGSNGSQRPRVFTQKGVKLARKHKAGVEPINQANAQATKPRELKERTRIGQPIFIKFPRVPGSSDFVVVELQRFSVKGIGAAGQELAGTFAVGLEIDQAPAGRVVKELSRDQVTISDDHVAKIEISNVTYEVVTASKLTP